MPDNRWIVLSVLLFARTGIGFQFISIAALIPQLKESLGLDYTQIGMLLGLFMLTSVFLSLPSGMMASRLGDRTALWIGLASLVTGSIVVGLSSTFSMALAGRLIGGIGAVFTTVTAAKLLIDWFSGREMSTAMSLLGVTWPIGIALGLSLLPMIESWAGWRTAVLVTAILPGLASLLTIAVPIVPPARSEPPKDAAPAVLWSIKRREFWTIIAGGAAWPLMSAGGYVVFTSYAPGLLISQGETPVSAGLTISLLSWLFIVTIPFGGFLADRTGRNDLMFWGGCLASAAAVAMVPVGGPVVLWVILISLMGFTVGPVMALPGEVLTPASRSTGVGLYYTLYYLGTTGLPALGGWLLEVTGAAPAVIWFSAACLVVAPFSLLALRLLQRRWGLFP